MTPLRVSSARNGARAAGVERIRLEGSAVLSQKNIRRYVKPLVFVVCIVPALPALHALLAVAANQFSGPISRAVVDTAGYWHFARTADPIAVLLHEQGSWALRFLLITLAVTPLRFVLDAPWLIGFRRMLGLYAFAYAALHFFVYVVLDQTLSWPDVLEDVAKRPYITIGVTALLLLTPLAITSTKNQMRRLGRRWHALHQLIYVIAPLGVWHFWWSVKKDVTEPLIYAGITVLLLGFRYWRKHLRVARSLAVRGPTAGVPRSA
jgi:sulfoxide reductase heme-binding subunit YedZ